MALISVPPTYIAPREMAKKKAKRFRHLTRRCLQLRNADAGAKSMNSFCGSVVLHISLRTGEVRGHLYESPLSTLHLNRDITYFGSLRLDTMPSKIKKNLQLARGLQFMLILSIKRKNFIGSHGVFVPPEGF